MISFGYGPMPYESQAVTIKLGPVVCLLGNESKSFKATVSDLEERVTINEETNVKQDLKIENIVIEINELNSTLQFRCPTEKPNFKSIQNKFSMIKNVIARMYHLDDTLAV